MIQTLTPNGANQPFRESVLPRTPWCSDDLVDPQRLNAAPELVAIDSITVADQIWLGVQFGEGFDQLLRGPFSTRMFRDSEMKYFPPLMLQHEKHKQNPQVDSGHGEEIDSHDFPDVILEERFPGL